MKKLLAYGELTSDCVTSMCNTVYYVTIHGIGEEKFNKNLWNLEQILFWKQFLTPVQASKQHFCFILIHSLKVDRFDFFPRIDSPIPGTLYTCNLYYDDNFLFSNFVFSHDFRKHTAGLPHWCHGAICFIVNLFPPCLVNPNLLEYLDKFGMDKKVCSWRSSRCEI